MSKLKYWEGIKQVELRAIPVVCGNCGAKVTVEGTIEDGEMVFENCPSCKAPIIGYLTMATEESAPEGQAPALSAKITWKIDGGRVPQCTMVIGDTRDVLDVLLSVITTGVNFYACGNLPHGRIYQLIVEFLVRRYIPLRGLQLISQAIVKRLEAQPEISGDSDLYMGENGGRTGTLKILDLGKERKSGDEEDDK